MGNKDDILKKLMESDDYISVEALIAQTKSSRRTIFRYITDLNARLSRYNLTIKNTYGRGLKIFGEKENAASLLSKTRRHADFSSFSPEMRRAVEIIVLCLNKTGETKVVTLSALLNVSDSCINSDFESIEKDFPQDKIFSALRLVQTKQGRYVTGSVWRRRMAAVHCAISIFPIEKLGQKLLYSEESDFLESIKEVIEVQIDHKKILSAVKKAESLLGCTFTLFDSIVLYLYLSFAVALPAEDSDESPFSLSPSVSEKIAAEVSSTAEIASKENTFLRYILSSMESVKAAPKPYLHSLVPNLLSAMEVQLIKDGLLDWAFSDDLRVSLEMQVNAMLFKKTCGIPQNAHDYDFISFENDLSVGKSIAEAAYPFAREKLGIDLSDEDLKPLRFSIASAIKNWHNSFSGLRLLVLCYEGICLSRLVASEIKAIFPNIEIVNLIGQVSLTESYLKENDIDILVTSVMCEKQEIGEIPCFKIPAPFNQTLFIEEFKQFLAMNPILSGKRNKKAIEIEVPDDPMAQAVHNVFKDFSITELKMLPDSDDLSSIAASIIATSDEKRRELTRDFCEREQKGHIYLETENIRMFHCRSDAVLSARAGLIRSKNDKTAVLFMTAPKKSERMPLLALSLISSTIIESEEFARALHSGTKEQIESLLIKLITQE